MRKYEMNDGYVYVGTAREISSLYKKFEKRELATPEFCNFPKFNMGKVYGLLVDNYDEFEHEFIDPRMRVVTLETVVDLLASGELYYESEEVKA